jgi:Sel1 repeat
VNRTLKAIIATLVSVVVIGLAIAYVPDLHVKAMLTFRRAASFVGLDPDPMEKARDAAQRGDFATALELWRPLAERGDAAAQDHLGAAYELGNGVPQDDATAVAWYRKAADQGNAMAQTNLGEMYEKAKVSRSIT